MRIFTLSLAIFLAGVSFATAAPKEICGVIKRFACADNCYLTIETKQGEVDGLCVAKTACVPWFEKQLMPRKYIGRSVRVTIGEDKQYDGNYTVVGTHLSFRKIRFQACRNDRICVSGLCVRPTMDRCRDRVRLGSPNRHRSGRAAVL